MVRNLFLFPICALEPKLNTSPAVKPIPRANARKKRTTGEMTATGGSFNYAFTTNGNVESRKISPMNPLTHHNGDQINPEGSNKPPIPMSII